MTIADSRDLAQVCYTLANFVTHTN